MTETEAQKSSIAELPVAVLGAGPVGLEAALALAERGVPFVLYEAAGHAAGAVRAWGHVRLFSPWSLDVSPAARRRLEAEGLEVPDGDACPTGEELADRVLDPLARLPEIAGNLRLGVRVRRIGRRHLLKHEEIGTGNRKNHPFRLLLEDADGRQWTELARAVLDCTGTFSNPNCLGDGGIPAPGEEAAGDAIRRTVPNFETEAEDWAGRTVLLVGAGHSAQTAARDFARFAETHLGSRLLWALRRESPGWQPLEDDPLPERSALMAAARALAEGGSESVEALFGTAVDAVAPRGAGWVVTLGKGTSGSEGPAAVEVDRILSLTGSVGDHDLYRQLQIHECYATEGPMKLAAALLGAGGGGDCLAQTSQGAEALLNPEPDFFILGSKSYGRNTTFLMRLGWQQVEETLSLLGLPAAPGATSAADP